MDRDKTSRSTSSAMTNQSGLQCSTVMSAGGYCLLMGDRRASRWDSPREAPPEEVAKSHGTVKQCIGTLVVSLASLNCGLSMKWVSPTPLALVAGACPVDELSGSAFTDSVSSSQYASFIAALLMGLTANYYGRKNALFLSCVVNLMGGGIFRNPTSSNLWLGRVCVSCNIITALTIVPMFVSEIAQKRFRGTLMLSSLFLIHIGVVCAFALRDAIPQKTYSNIFIAVPFVQLLLLTFIPETPYFLVSKHRTLEAEGSLFWYRGSNRSVAKGELTILLKASPKIHMSWWKMITSQGTKNALIISVGLVFFKRLSGFVIFCCYSGFILRKADDSDDPSNAKKSTLLLAGIQLVSGVLGVILIDLVGRKALLYVSQFGNVIFLSIFSVYLIFKSMNSGESWLPFICLCGFIFTSNVGVSTMTSVISNEVTPIRLKGIIAATDGILTSLLVLAAVQCYPFIADHVGNYLNFVIPAVINVIGLVFTWVVVPETKSKSLHEILMKMNGQKCDSDVLKMKETHL